jgi:hypothetical protein
MVSPLMEFPSETSVLRRRLVDRLYARAEQLSRNRRWADIPGSEMWAYEMISTVIRFLERKPLQAATEAEYLRIAEMLLCRCVRYHAWSRIRRWRAKFADIKASHGVSLEAHCDVLQATGRMPTFPAPDTMLAGSLRDETIVEALQHLGFSPEMAWAFVWRVVDRESWADIVHLLRRHRGAEVTEGQLRQWDHRYFGLDRVVPAISAVLSGQAVKPLRSAKRSPIGVDRAEPQVGRRQGKGNRADASRGRPVLVCGRAWKPVHPVRQTP